MEKLYIDVRGFSNKKKERVQDAFFKLGIYWIHASMYQYLCAGGYTNVYAMNGVAEGNLMFSSGIASEHQRKYEVTYTDLMRKAGMDDSDPDKESESIEMSDLKLQPGDYTTREEIKAYAKRVGLTAEQVYLRICDAFIVGGASFGEGVEYFTEDGLTIYSWSADTNGIHFGSLNDTDDFTHHLTRHLSPEQILITSKQKDLQSEKQAEQFTLPTRDLQSVINDYLHLLETLTNKQARNVVNKHLTYLTDLQYKQYAASIIKETNNT